MVIKIQSMREVYLLLLLLLFIDVDVVVVVVVVITSSMSKHDMKYLFHRKPHASNNVRCEYFMSRKKQQHTTLVEK